MDFNRSTETGNFELSGTPEEIAALATKAEASWGEDELTATLKAAVDDGANTVTIDREDAADFADMLEGDEEFGELADGLIAAMDAAQQDAVQRAESSGE